MKRGARLTVKAIVGGRADLIGTGSPLVPQGVRAVFARPAAPPRTPRRGILEGPGRRDGAATRRKIRVA